MVQGRKIALAQEEALNLRIMMQSQITAQQSDNTNRKEPNVFIVIIKTR